MGSPASEELYWDLPLDFPPQVVAIGRNVHGFEPVDRYRLPDLWTLNLYGYEATLKLGTTLLPIRPGSLGVVPPGASMEYRYQGVSVHLYAHFRAGGGMVRRIRAMQDTGAAYEQIYRRLYEIIPKFGSEPARVNARVWDLLWEASSWTDRENSMSAEAHRAVRSATDLIDRQIAQPLSVVQLAEAVGVSSGYLVRLFRQTYDSTVVGYIRRRRVERAVHLLERSTLPIKAIAFSVGFPDLQHFNKVVRAERGLGPRELRTRAEAKL